MFKGIKPTDSLSKLLFVQDRRRECSKWPENPNPPLCESEPWQVSSKHGRRGFQKRVCRLARRTRQYWYSSRRTRTPRVSSPLPKDLRRKPKLQIRGKRRTGARSAPRPIRGRQQVARNVARDRGHGSSGEQTKEDRGWFLGRFVGRWRTRDNVFLERAALRIRDIWERERERERNDKPHVSVNLRRIEPRSEIRAEPDLFSLDLTYATCSRRVILSGVDVYSDCAASCRSWTASRNRTKSNRRPR